MMHDGRSDFDRYARLHFEGLVSWIDTLVSEGLERDPDWKPRDAGGICGPADMRGSHLAPIEGRSAVGPGDAPEAGTWRDRPPML